MGQKLKTHTFNGRRYNIVITDPLDGSCATYKPERELCIMAPLETKNGLITAVHEALHALNWRSKEGEVEQAGKELGTFLWRLGFRLQK